ncbi:MAG TPA: hypothetical protein H9844_07670 [Candidatus Evtepia faecigallinarum]|nr:hypothetical protein [Candidatus Evtepia faecigallinarum]
MDNGFQKRLLACVVILMATMGVAMATGQTGFANVGWFIVGVWFLLRPVWPARWAGADPKRMRLVCQVAGTVLILLAMLVRFGV